MRAFVDRLLAELPALSRAARRWTRSEAEAEDLVQSAVVRALEHRSDLRDLDRMRAWALRVQRSVLLDEVRTARRRLEVLAPEPRDGAAPSCPVDEPRGNLEAEVVDRGFGDELERALAALPEPWREALLCREVEELSYEEIASLQRCPVGTVRSRLSRAREALLEALSASEIHRERRGGARGPGATGTPAGRHARARRAAVPGMRSRASSEAGTASDLGEERQAEQKMGGSHASVQS